jgi:hypothetical protein
MPGPPAKDPAVRQRRNVKTEAADLTAPPADFKPPELPNPDKREWHELTKAWWTNLWKSPMAPRFLSTDADALGMVALLIDDFYKCTSSKERRELSAEIRQQTSRFGLSNWDRNRMNWTVSAPPEEKPRPQSNPQNENYDPRKVLKFTS